MIIRVWSSKNDNQWEIEKRNMKYKINPDEVYMNLATRSLYLIAKYVSLSDSEAQAILYHDGQYVEGNKERTRGRKDIYIQLFQTMISMNFL